MAYSVSRRTFLGVAGGAAAALAGLGLAGCAKEGGSGGAGSATGASPQNGVPATTPLNQLPLPEKGKTYNNPKSRDQIKDGGTATFPVAEVGPDFNYFSVNGNTTYMKWFWLCYNSAVVPFRCNATASKFEPDPNFIDSSSVKEVDGKEVVTINIAEKATFNDGTPIDWRAVEAAWTVNNGKNSDYTPASTDGWSQVESVTKGDNDKQAIITFSQPYYPYEALVGFLHPSAATPEVFNNGWKRNPHNEWGCGPFVVDSVDEAQITFKRNSKWWGDVAKLESITFKQMEAQAQFNAFKNGEIDATELGQQGTGEMLSNFQGMDKVEIRRSDSKSIACLEVNTTRDVLSDIEVRKALMQCINTETILGIVYQGVNWKEDRLSSLSILPWMDGYEDNLPQDVSANITADAQIAAAKKTLEDAGYELGSDGYYAKGGKQVAFGFTAIGDSNVTKNRAAAIQKMAKDAGIKLELQNKAASEFSSTLTGGEWDTILTSWGFVVTAMWYGKMIFGSHSVSNYTQWGTPELDAEFDRINSIKDSADQLKAYNAAEKKALESYCFIPLYAGPDVVVTKKGLANFGPALFQTVLPQDVGWEKTAS